MAGERFVDLAVTSVAAYVRANYPTKLRALETAQSLAANSLEDPLEYLEANSPMDLRSPLVEVFDTAARCIDHHGDVWQVDVTIALSFTGDADVSANEKRMRRYATALKDTIRASSTLGSKVPLADLGDYSSEVVRGSNSTTRYVFTLGVRVGVDD